MQLKEVMTRQVEEIGPDATIQDAARKMRTLDVGSLPVCKDGEVVGLITDRDIAIRAVAAGRDPNQTLVRDAMTERTFHCYEDQDVDVAVKLMEKEQIRRVPVFDRNERLAGIFSLGDLAERVGNDHLSGEALERISQPNIAH